jgi:hypothetical protein
MNNLPQVPVEQPEIMAQRLGDCGNQEIGVYPKQVFTQIIQLNPIPDPPRPLPLGESPGE